MTATRPSTPVISPATDAPVHARAVLASLWVAMLFVFAYVDIFAFWRADVINGALAGRVPTSGFTIDQTFLALTTLYILVPSLMVVGSVVLPRRVLRPLSVVLAVAYAITIAASTVGETWLYFLIGSAVEVALLAFLVVRAVRWR